MKLKSLGRIIAGTGLFKITNKTKRNIRNRIEETRIANAITGDKKIAEKEIKKLSNRSLENIVARCFYYKKNPDKIELNKDDKDKFLELMDKIGQQAEQELESRKERQKIKSWAKYIAQQ